MTEIVLFPHSDPRFAMVHAIRLDVFVDEQRCPEEEEWDDKDTVAIHCLAFRDSLPVGTFRYFDDEGWFHFGRLAVARKARGMGIGAELMSSAMRAAKANGFTKAFMNVQIDKTAFYERYGFVAVGTEFIEAGISHVRMEAHFPATP